MTMKKNKPHLSHAGKPGMKWGYSYGTPNGKRKAAKMAADGVPYDVRKHELELLVVKKSPHKLKPTYTHYTNGIGLRSTTSAFEGVFAHHVYEKRGLIDNLVHKIGLFRNTTKRAIKKGRRWIESLSD